MTLRSVFPLAALVALLAALAAPESARAQFENFDDLGNLGEQIRILGDGIRFDPDSDEVTYDGSVAIEYDNVSIYADRAFYDTRRRVVRVEGDVTIYQGEFVYRGQDATYNLATERLSSNSLRTYVLTPNGRVFADAGRFDIDTAVTDKFSTYDSYLTGHDNPEPNWRVDADRIDIYPNDKMVFRHMVLRVGDLPVFYLPYYSQPFDDQLGYQFSPGYDGDWGFFLLNRYGLMLGQDDHTLMQVRADIRTERGLAGGLDFYSQRWRQESNFGRLFLYYANDADPSTGGSRRDRERADLDSNRYRVNFQHRIYLRGYDDTWDVDPDTGETVLVRRGEPVDPNLYVDFDLNYLSDEFFYEDFFPAEAQVDPQPDTIVNLIRRDPRYEASLLTRLRLNDAFTRDERLPEAGLELVRQPLGALGVLYQGSNSAGYLTEDLALTRRRFFEERQDGINQAIADNGGLASPEQLDELARLQRQLDSQSYFRADSYHQFSRPYLAGGFLQLVPRLGVRGTTWNGVETGDDETRFLGHAGLEGSVKFTRRWDAVDNRGLGLDGLMHVIRPYVDWSYVGGDELGEGFHGIDTLPRTTRSRTLDLAQYQAIDEINNWHVVRLGLFNHLLTRRDQQTHNWLAYNTFLDFFLDDPEFDRDFSNWYHEIDWRPLPWLALGIDGQLPIGDDDQSFTEWNTDLTWMPRDWFEFRIGHRLLQDSEFFEDSNQVTFDTYVRLNEDWGLSMGQRYEGEDGTLEYQQYGIHRDLETWTTALTVLLRDERDETNFGVVFNLTLKQFPQVSLPLSLTPGGSGGDR